MALTLPKWLLVAALGCATLWLGLLYDRHESVTTDPDQVAKERPARPTNVYTLGGTMSRAADRLRLLKIRDSVIREAARRRTAGLTVMISDAYEPTIAHALDSLLHQRWQSLGGSSGVPVIIAAVLDSATTEGGVPRGRPSYSLPVSVFLPQATDGSTCVSIMRIPVPSAKAPAFLHRNLLSPETVGALLGPCMYLAAFGAPGANVEQWLRRGGWRVAHYSDWTAPAQPWTPIDRGLQPVLLERIASLNDPTWRLREVVGIPGLACLAGQPDRCARAAMPVSSPDADSAWKKGVVSSNGSNEFLFYAPRVPLPLGPSDGWILSEMARTLGTQKFTLFWRSADSVPQAFRSATEQSLDDWIRAWGRRVYGPVTTGPHLASTDFLAGLVLAALALAGSVAIGRRRRVT